MAQEDGPVYRFAGRVLDLRRGILASADGPIDLRPKSLAVLVHLVRNAGRVIGRDELLTKVWPDVIVGDDSLTQCVRDLRRAIGHEARTLAHHRPPRVAVLPFALDGLAFAALLDGDPEAAADWGRAALRLNPPVHARAPSARRRPRPSGAAGRGRGRRGAAPRAGPGLTVSGFARASLYRFSGRLDVITDGLRLAGLPDQRASGGVRPPQDADARAHAAPLLGGRRVALLLAGLRLLGGFVFRAVAMGRIQPAGVIIDLGRVHRCSPLLWVRRPA
jgi:hypothetical protein